MVPLKRSQRWAGEDNSPPRNGPIVKPRPKAAPINPILFAIDSESEISPMKAFATAILALKAPARNLAVNAIQRDEESPNIVKKTVFPTNPVINTGLRPIRSERAPQNGEKRNWAAEYPAIISATQKPISKTPSIDAKSSIKKVKKGITMPKPIMSIMTTRNRTESAPERFSEDMSNPHAYAT